MRLLPLPLGEGLSHDGPPGTPWTHRAGAEKRAPITPASLVPRITPLSYDDELPILGLWLLFSRSVVSDSLRPHGLQRAGHPCPSRAPRVCLSSCPWSR